MVMIPSQLRYLVQVCEAEEVRSKDGALNRLYIAKGRSGVPVALSGPFLGAPHAVMAMEKLVVLGASRIWVLGWCGSLQPGLRIGDLLIPTEAISEEGTSAHYPIGDKPPESAGGLNRILEGVLTEQRIGFRKGLVWTTDAVYRETPDKVKTYQTRGVLAVEMEMSALMTVATYRSVEMAGLLSVSDELFDLKWRHGFSSPLLKESSRQACRIVAGLAGFESVR